MTPDTAVTAPGGTPDTSPGRTVAEGPARRPRTRPRLAAPALAALAVALAGFNAWWYWRDARPLADPKTVAAWVRHKRYDEAEPALRERLRRAPHDGEARITLARVLAARGDLLGCARQLHEVPFWWPKKPEALFHEGNAYLMVDRARDAEAAWLAVVKDDPLHPVAPDLFHDATSELLKLYATEDRWEDSHAVLWRAYDEATADDRQTLLTWRIRSELERVAPSEALPRLRRYVAAAPDDTEALRALARDEQALGLHREAERHFQACLKARPDDPRGWRDYLAFLHERGDRDAWLAALSRVPKAAESEAEVWKFRGEAKEKAGDLAGAAADYREAIRRNPNVVEFHHRLAMAEERLGHREPAAEHRKRARQMRSAREQLPTAFAKYMEARDRGAAARPDLVASIDRLAEICQALGFVRAAEAWNRLKDAS